MPVVWHEAYEVDIGPHVFPTAKYRLVRDRLFAERVIGAADMHRPDAASDADVCLVHTDAYVTRIREDRLSPIERLQLEVPFSAALREASWLCAGGAILASRLARASGVAVHLGGGFHHAFPDHGEGFCLINDVAIAIRVLQQAGEITRAMVIDCDVHHGNGTAAVFGDDATVFTFSIHQEQNYPAWKPPSDLDIGLDDGCGDEEYLKALERYVPQALDRHRPDLVWYLAGADPYREDQLGGLSLTIAGLRARDEAVLGWCAEGQVAAAVALAGGYALRHEDTVEIHCNSVRAAVATSARGAP
ncbi:MAG: histone deacetylase [Gemmatimonadetes bacterium RBG_16_66_8]|nr:MAG: histone deacetylase [Gemmatimonadetes bacterium RBG_16_66_8]